MENILKRIIKSIKVNENTVSLLLGVVIVIVVGGMIYNYFQDTPTQLPVIEDSKVNEILADINATESATSELASNNLTITPKVTTSPTNTPKPTATNTPIPTNTPTSIPTPTSTIAPTLTPTPVLISPTVSVLVSPTNIPTSTPTKIESPQGQIASGVSTQNNQGNVASVSVNKHTVVSGENLWRIAEKYYNSGYAWVEIAKANNLNRSQVGVISVGQELNIPQTTKEYAQTIKSDTSIASTSTPNQITSDSYVVVKGDNLWNIAVRAYGDGFQWTKIVEANKDLIKNPRYIEIGMNLKIVK